MARSRKHIGEGHLASHLRDALAEDPRVHVLDVEVQVVGGRCHLHGQVRSEELRQAAETIAREVCEGMPVVNRIEVVGEPAHGPHHERVRR